MTCFILFNKEALEKVIILSCSNIFLVHENTKYTDIFIVRRVCFPKFSSRKDAHFFVFVTQKSNGNVTFSDYGNLRKSPKISSFRIFSRIYTIRKHVILCSVSSLRRYRAEFFTGYIY